MHICSITEQMWALAWIIRGASADVVDYKSIMAMGGVEVVVVGRCCVAGIPREVCRKGRTENASFLPQRSNKHSSVKDMQICLH